MINIKISKKIRWFIQTWMLLAIIFFLFFIAEYFIDGGTISNLLIRK